VITEHDTEIKVRKLRSLLQEGYRVRVSIQFKHRENFNVNSARNILTDIFERVRDIATKDSKQGLKVSAGQSVQSLLIPKLNEMKQQSKSSLADATQVKALPQKSKEEEYHELNESIQSTSSQIPSTQKKKKGTNKSTISHSFQMIFILFSHSHTHTHTHTLNTH
jgi:hypothetical protein